MIIGSSRTSPHRAHESGRAAELGEHRGVGLGRGPAHVARREHARGLARTRTDLQRGRDGMPAYSSTSSTSVGVAGAVSLVRPATEPKERARPLTAGSTRCRGARPRASYVPRAGRGRAASGTPRCRPRPASSRRRAGGGVLVAVLVKRQQGAVAVDARRARRARRRGPGRTRGRRRRRAAARRRGASPTPAVPQQRPSLSEKPGRRRSGMPEVRMLCRHRRRHCAASRPRRRRRRRAQCGEQQRRAGRAVAPGEVSSSSSGSLGMTCGTEAAVARVPEGDEVLGTASRCIHQVRAVELAPATARDARSGQPVGPVRICLPRSAGTLLRKRRGTKAVSASVGSPSASRRSAAAWPGLGSRGARVGAPTRRRGLSACAEGGVVDRRVRRERRVAITAAPAAVGRSSASRATASVHRPLRERGARRARRPGRRSRSTSSLSGVVLDPGRRSCLLGRPPPSRRSLGRVADTSASMWL